MTVLTDAQITAPHFPTCPTWCDQHDVHDPYGEVGHQHGVETLAPRLHEAEFPRVSVAALRHGHHADISVSVFREDHGSYLPHHADTGAPTIEVGAFEHHGHSVVFRPTPAEARRLATALLAAADLLDGTSR